MANNERRTSLNRSTKRGLSNVELSRSDLAKINHEKKLAEARINIIIADELIRSGYIKSIFKKWRE